ncbi:F0F1-type ATP synthase, epsilon subunit (mitochondrial delta subunit) [Legionella busanensis]|uniref:F0F1-type ATP synthase, epsilon subunit (Mitochondrial delta subunit) n=1 Tax=Legionella busanensis TaxID=190655 RepID=A0A378JLX0_9GAMM|nr:ligase-associated DNA damage response exonuclease [Legionella busanensis]STX52077.1 F0F1-type ATP synthase, epsilon subunit (mitochondrial delta subunit) [Legionella busanensis]
MHPKKWLAIKKEGLYCIPGQFYIDPVCPVDKAIITHAHADHARSGHQAIIAHTATIDIMKVRYTDNCANQLHALSYHEHLLLNDVELYLLPAGHILGSSQVVIEYKGSRLIISGDYKRTFDPTCEGFIAEPCDVFITEATFSLPIFKHPPIEVEVNKLLHSVAIFPERCHLVGVYALGKCQRLIKTLRILGYFETIYIHGALKKLCDYYESQGIKLGHLEPASTLDKHNSQGKIVLCPPSALHDKWSRRFAQVIICMASGWMQIRARAKQKGIELPLIISDHADWYELIQTIHEINPKEVWVTHGREEALVHYATQQGYWAQALHLLGYDDPED